MHLRRHALLALCVLAFATPASAQDPQVDPGSPAGTEYQLPLDHARKQSGDRSKTSTTGSPSAAAPLFGEGVEAKPRARRRESATGGTARRGSDAGPDARARTPQTAQARASAPDSGGSGLLAIGGAAVGVLLLGGLAGLAWRRRAARP